MVVSEIMTASPVTAEVTQTVRDALRLLRQLDARHLPVVDGGRLAGIVSDRDLREITAPLMEGLEPKRAAQLLDQPLSAVMSSDVQSVHGETELEDAIDLMIEHRVGAVPVVDASTQGLVGIVSYIDVLRAARPHL